MSNVTPLESPRRWDESPFHVGDRIRKVRELVGFGNRKTAFAQIVGADRGTLAKYEAGDQRPKPAVLSAIALKTGARLEWLQYEKGPVFEETGPKDLTAELAEVGPTGLEPVTSTVESGRFAGVAYLEKYRRPHPVRDDSREATVTPMRLVR